MALIFTLSEFTIQDAHAMSHELQVAYANGSQSPPSDNSPPVVTPPPNQVVTVTNSNGIAVNYPQAAATDNVGVTSAPTCNPSSGSIFPVGITTVTCTASDAAGNVGQATFTVIVQSQTTTSNLRVDSFGVQQFYAQKVGKQSIVMTSDPNTQEGFRLDGMGPANPQVQDAFHYYTIDSRVGNLASGGTQLTLRIDLNPLLSNGTTAAWLDAEQRGYQVAPQDIDEFEQTGYFRIRNVVSDNHITYKQGGEHMKSDPNLAGSFGMDINFGGIYNDSSSMGATSEKELVFPQYEFFHDQRLFNTGNITNKWIGIKEISRHTSNGQLYEDYIDLDPIDFATGKPNNNWQAFTTHLDDGSEKGMYAGHITSWGKKFFQYRFNQAQNIDFALLSVYHIDTATGQNIPISTNYSGTVDTIPSKIPNWVKNIFNFYGQGEVSDDDLIKALQFLIQQGIIKVN